VRAKSQEATETAKAQNKKITENLRRIEYDY
jgi:hypothetical protein